jgi:hypothetical protein
MNETEKPNGQKRAIDAARNLESQQMYQITPKQFIQEGYAQKIEKGECVVIFLIDDVDEHSSPEEVSIFEDYVRYTGGNFDYIISIKEIGVNFLAQVHTVKGMEALRQRESAGEKIDINKKTSFLDLKADAKLVVLPYKPLDYREPYTRPELPSGS